MYTQAIYGWMHFLVLARRRMPFLPEDVRIVVFFDSKLERNNSGDADSIPLSYKANRKETPESLRAQIELATQLTELLGIAFVKERGYEADSLLGSFVLNERERSSEIYIRSSDKDMRQLVCDNVKMVSQHKSEIIVEDTDTVIAKHGVHPNQIADLLILQGDASDNIPGIPGIGKVTAQKLLKEFGSIDNMVANKEKIAGKVGENFRNNLGLLPQLRRLVTFQKGPVRIQQRPADIPAVKTWLNYLEMHKTLNLFP